MTTKLIELIRNKAAIFLKKEELFRRIEPICLMQSLQTVHGVTAMVRPFAKPCTVSTNPVVHCRHNSEMNSASASNSEARYIYKYSLLWVFGKYVNAKNILGPLYPIQLLVSVFSYWTDLNQIWRDDPPWYTGPVVLISPRNITHTWLQIPLILNASVLMGSISAFVSLLYCIQSSFLWPKKMRVENKPFWKIKIPP